MNNESRSSDSPASTVDSTESTSVSVDTIVDCNPSAESHMIEKQTATMANSTNTTNNYNKNSLTNSQISMISSDDHKDAIYNNPELLLTESDTKPVLSSVCDEKQPPNKPPPLPEKLAGQIPVKRKKNSNFPIQILLGIIQFALSIALVALGGLLLVRGASFATTGCGIWSGAIAAIAGALAVINMRSAQTGFLAVSLICVASGTLALALAGSGLVRDMNRLEQEQSNHESIKAAISASCGLIFALVLHLLVSITSVYQSAIKICSRGKPSQMLDNVITVNNASMVGQQKVEEYFSSIAHSPHTRGKQMLPPENADKLMAMWMYTAKHGSHHRHHHQHQHQHHHATKAGVAAATAVAGRPIMLVPAGNGMLPPLAYRHPSAYMLAPNMLPAPMSLPYAGLQLPVLPNAASLHPEDLKTLYRLRAAHKPVSEIGKHYHHHQTQQRRTGRNEASKRQRRRSESDAAENGQAFTYTGLDRAIADSFLKQQEQSNSSHAGYSSGESLKDGEQDVSV